MDTLLTLNLNPQLEEDLVDYLLELDHISGFTSWPVRGHGRHGAMSLAEQVSGRRQRILVQVLLNAEQVPALLAGLAVQVGRDITWWQQPVSGSGRVE
ncbi:MAG: DUF3240 family protein [Gammaproteobacteria bacterium]|jgi:hypothetical protein